MHGGAWKDLGHRRSCGAVRFDPSEAAQREICGIKRPVSARPETAAAYVKLLHKLVQGHVRQSEQREVAGCCPWDKSGVRAGIETKEKKAQRSYV